MKIIERYWIYQWISQSLFLFAMILVLQSFFQATREMKYLSEQYTCWSMSRYIILNQLIGLAEIIPVILYLSAIQINDRWKDQGYFRNAMLDGITTSNWNSLGWKITTISLFIGLPLWLLTIPHTDYQLKMNHQEERGFKIESLFEPGRLYTMGPIAYLEHEDRPGEFFDLKKEVLMTSHEKNLTHWKQKFSDLSMGVNKLTYLQKIHYLHDEIQMSPSQSDAIRISLTQDYLYIGTLLLSIYGFSRDRLKGIVDERRFLSKRPWALRVFHTIFLYWGVKIIPAFVRYFSGPILVSGYFLIGLTLFS